MESFTFSDDKVQQRLNQMMLLQVDITANTDEQQALLKRFALVGPPAILFFKQDGQEQRNLRVVGFMKADPFMAQLDKVLAK
jgi:thiol:disulfide interchange protein DsbD